MYGLVNAAVENLIRTNFGDDTWQSIRAKAGITVTSFSRMEQYPDDVTYRLVAAASEVLKMSSDDVMRAFGEFWVLYTGREGYGHLFEMGGSTLFEFIGNLDAMHSRVGQSFDELKPPAFEHEMLDDRSMRLHYRSTRAGLCPMVTGLLQGLGGHFHTGVDVTHPVCSRDGAEHCEFVVALKDA